MRSAQPIYLSENLQFFQLIQRFEIDQLYTDLNPLKLDWTEVFSRYPPTLSKMDNHSFERVHVFPLNRDWKLI